MISLMCSLQKLITMGSRVGGAGGNIFLLAGILCSWPKLFLREMETSIDIDVSISSLLSFIFSF